MNSLKKINMAVIAAILVILTSCDPMSVNHSREFRDSKKWGKVVQKDIQLSAFDAIASWASVDVRYIQSDSLRVVAEGNEKAIECYKFEVVEDSTETIASTCLNITWDQQSYSSSTPAIILYVYAPTLFNVSLEGEGNFDVEDSIYLENLNINIKGAGDVSIYSLACNDFSINMNSAGDATIRRIKADNMSVTVNGSGDINIKKAKLKGLASLITQGAGDIDGEIKADDILAYSKGAGCIEIEVDCDAITVISTGAGDVEIEGFTHTLTKNREGLGGIKTRHLEAAEVILDKNLN